MSEGSLDEHGVAIALIVSYGCLLVFTVSLLVGMLRSAGKCAWKPRYTFLALILLLTCLRLPNWILLLLQAHDANVTDEINRQWYFWALFNMCAMIYLTLFTELIVFWADLHDSLRPAVLDGSKRFTNKQRRFFQLMVLGFMWMVYVGVFVSFFFLSDFDTFNLIYSYVTCAFFAVSALVCAFVGIRVYRRVMEMPLRTVAVTARVRRVAITCAIVTFAFSARAILNGVLPSLQHGFTDTQKWILYTATFIGIEVIPLFVVELLVVMPPKPRHDDSIENEVRQAYQAHYSYTQLDKSLPKSMSEPIN